MKLSVVILNYNVRYFLELCLRSVEAAIKNIEAEIIVVDNNSSDTSSQMVKTLFPQVKFIHNNENLGFSKGNNIGVKQAQGKYICILNPDTVVVEETFENLLTFAALQEDLGIVGTRLIDGMGRFLPESKRNIPTPFVSVKKLLGNSRQYYATQINQHDATKVDILVGAFMFMEKELYTKMQGFDEDYFMYGEDVDICYRVLKEGYNNYYYGDATTLHFKGESTMKDKVYAKRFYDAMQIFYKKHFRNHGLYDFVIWIGSAILSFFMKVESDQDATIPEAYVFVSKEEKETFGGFGKPYAVQDHLDTYQKGVEYIFDTHSFTFKQIIQWIDGFPENSGSTFKFLLPKSQFMVGSNSSKTRGKVHQLEKN